MQNLLKQVLVSPRLNAGFVLQIPISHKLCLLYKYLSSSLNYINKKERMSNRKRIVAIPKTTTTTTTFLPTSIAGCQLWLDGADATTKTFSGSNLTVWNDKSGNARHMNSLPPSANAGASVYPTSGTSINGLATVNFIPQSGIKQSTTLGGVTNLFWVGRIAAPGANYGENYYFLLGHDNSYDWCGRPYGDKFVDLTYTQSGIYNASPVSLFTPDANAIANATFSSVYMPSAPNVSILSVAGITGSTNYQGLCYDRIYHHGWCGDLAEVIIFSTALSTPNRQTIESYLAQKWGLTASLTAGHPGLTTSVYIQTVALAVPKQKISSIPKMIFVSFLPTSITGCALWMDGADPAGNGVVPANGATVSTWADKSGTGNNATRLGGSMTYTTSRGVVFDGTSASGYSVPSGTFPTGNTYYSIFLVVETSLPANKYSHMFSSGSAVGGQAIDIPIYPNGLVETGWWTTNIQSAAGVVTANTKIILGTTYNSSGLRLYGNATSIAFSSSLGARNSPSTLGYIGTPPGGPGGSQNFIGTMYEALLFSGEMTNTQHQNVESYLAQKWGLTSSLPVGHPGLTTTVYGTTTAAPTVRQKIRALPPPVLLVSYTQAFAYTGANQTFVVPATTTSITVYMWGAGGGGYYPTQSYGGAGCYLTGTLTVTPGETLSILVGQGGTIQYPAQTGVATRFGGGGPIISTGGNGNAQYNGSGGGRSAIQRSGADIVSAGAGGGCGTQAGSGNGHDGGTGSWTGTGGNGANDKYGLGGTQSAGGASQGNGLAGTALIGGRSDPWGGGGGGGYYGGGGGSDNNAYGSGGGGGSSYTALLTNASGSNGTLNVAPNTASIYYVSGVAVGGTQALSGNGGNGRIVLVYMA